MGSCLNKPKLNKVCANIEISSATKPQIKSLDIFFSAPIQNEISLMPSLFVVREVNSFSEYTVKTPY